ncbi:MAG: hypothetical protein PHP62_03190 [Candidatus Moranbacteria bacterium]|nr:hypothetical protein [Candidatus Moranbacteria bacterium]
MENIDTSKELVIYQNKFWLVLWIVMIILIGCSPLIIGVQTTDQSKIILRYVLSIGSILISLIISRQFFIKTPLLRVNKEGFFARKTGDVLWNDVENMSMLAIPHGASLIVVKLKNGNEFKINPVNMRLADEGVYNPNRGFGIFEIMNAYWKSEAR